jgi:hypothetical protein
MNNPGYDIELKLLQTIVGERLSSVEFVEDYVQMRFNGATLTAFTQPTVSIDNQTLHWGEPGYRDELCRQIGHPVKSVSIRAGEFIEVLFDDNMKVQISIRDRDYRGAEAAKFDSVSGDWWVI